jgi:hypothetical protein
MVEWSKSYKHFKEEFVFCSITLGLKVGFETDSGRNMIINKTDEGRKMLVKKYSNYGEDLNTKMHFYSWVTFHFK